MIILLEAFATSPAIIQLNAVAALLPPADSNGSIARTQESNGGTSNMHR